MQQLHPQSNLVIKRRHAKLKRQGAAVHLCPTSACLFTTDSKEQLESHLAECDSNVSRVMGALEHDEIASSGEDMGTDSSEELVVMPDPQRVTATLGDKPSVAKADGDKEDSVTSSRSRDSESHSDDDSQAGRTARHGGKRKRRKSELHLRANRDGFSCFFCDYQHRQFINAADHTTVEHPQKEFVVRNNRRFKNNQLCVVFFCASRWCQFTCLRVHEMVDHYETNVDHLPDQGQLFKLRNGRFSMECRGQKKTAIDDVLNSVINDDLPLDDATQTAAVRTPAPAKAPPVRYDSRFIVRCLHCMQHSVSHAQMRDHLLDAHARNLPIALNIGRFHVPYEFYCTKGNCLAHFSTRRAYENHDRECSKPVLALDVPYCYLQDWHRAAKKFLHIHKQFPIITRDWFGELYCPPADWYFCAHCLGLPFKGLTAPKLDLLRLHTVIHHVGKECCATSPREFVAERAKGNRLDVIITRMVCRYTQCQFTGSGTELLAHYSEAHRSDNGWNAIPCPFCAQFYSSFDDERQERLAHYRKHRDIITARVNNKALPWYPRSLIDAIFTNRMPNMAAAGLGPAGQDEDENEAKGQETVPVPVSVPAQEAEKVTVKVEVKTENMDE